MSRGLPPRTEAPGGAAPRISVGLVDDHDAIRIALSAAFEQTPDLRLAAAATTVDHLLSAGSGRPELVILDLRLAASIVNDPRIQHAKLSRHEQHILSLFADGHTAQHVADSAGIALSTVEDSIRRIRAKYAAAGRTAATKVDLCERAIEDGFLPAPTTR